MMRGFFNIVLLAALIFLPGCSQSLLADATNAASAPALVPSPVQLFRELLVMTPEELAGQLEIRPPEMRAPIEAKVKEYLAISAEERELRLQATELRHFLSLLMPLHPTNRAPLMAQIAEPMRSAVEARLVVWNIMPPQMQEELLANEQVVRHFTQLGVMSAAQRKAMLDDMPADQRAKLEADIARWKALPETTRKGVFAQMSQFFDLTGSEREKAMRNLSVAERDAMKQTLVAFAALTPDQRQTCIRSFEKFAGMSLADRQIFLKKAEAWQKMTPSERERWREVVTRVPQWPPFPPGMEEK